MSELPLIDRVRFDREAASVERCHVRPHLLRYSVGHHTHDVVSLLVHCWKEDHEGQLPRAELLVAGLAHDKGELVTGDVPSPTKDLLGAELEELDRRVEVSLYGELNLTEEEQVYLYVADRFELWLWCLEEIERGNHTFRPWEVTTSNRLRKLGTEGKVPPAFGQLFREYLNKAGRHALRGDEIMDIGGLE